MKPDPDYFGFAQKDVKIEFSIKCGCGVAKGTVHYLRAQHPATQTTIEHDFNRHGDPHYRKTRLRLVRDLVVAATGDAPRHPLLDDHRYDREFQ